MTHEPLFIVAERILRSNTDYGNTVKGQHLNITLVSIDPKRTDPDGRPVMNEHGGFTLKFDTNDVPGFELGKRYRLTPV